MIKTENSTDRINIFIKRI